MTATDSRPPCPDCGASASRCAWYGRTRRVYSCDQCAKRHSDPAVVEVRTSSGWRGWRNVRGPCEDAPCCGCCTY